ncbi:MAG: DUF3820 family protein [Polyangiaceae bacterium]|nr:DUF3820 family protein [Polyangiaceae bacterium]
MPFGRDRGRRLLDLPDAYLVRSSRQGSSAGKLGNDLRMMHELEQNGFDPLRRSFADQL